MATQLQDPGDVEEVETTNLPAIGDERPLVPLTTKALDPRFELAHRHPRNLALVKQRIRAEAAAAGEEWIWRMPIGGKVQSGLSVHGALAVARIYGNCEIKAIEDPAAPMGKIVVLGILVDFESNFTMALPYSGLSMMDRPGSAAYKIATGNPDKEGSGNPYLAHAVDFGNTRSRAVRNVVEKSLPDLCDLAFTVARINFAKKFEDPKQRAEAIAKIKLELEELGIDVRRVELREQARIDHLLAPQVAKVLAEVSGIRAGMASPDEIFPPFGSGAKDVEHDEVPPKQGRAGVARVDEKKPDPAKPAQSAEKPKETKAPKADEKKPAAKKAAPAAKTAPKAAAKTQAKTSAQPAAQKTSEPPPREHGDPGPGAENTGAPADDTREESTTRDPLNDVGDGDDFFKA